MADIAVVHPDLGTHGGAESVCMHVLEALQSSHELTVFTLTHPNISALNQYFRTDVRSPQTHIAGRLGPALNRRAGHRLGELQAALLGRYVSEHAGGYDLVFSTKNEFVFEAPSIQYVHSPQFVTADPGIDKINAAQRAYDSVCRRLARVSARRLSRATYLANSDWTANVIGDTHGVTAETVYPPVDASVFPDRPWADREMGFVSIGRIGPSKRLMRNIRVVAALRERGHDVHLHIVGPTTNDEYSARVERAAAQRTFVSLEGPLKRDELVALVTGHRYGLHGRPYEHFGIAVAELVAGGTIPFVPNSGGQREILGGDSRLLYDSTEDAVEKADVVLSDLDIQHTLRADLRGTLRSFGRDRFINKIRTVVERVLS